MKCPHCDGTGVLDAPTIGALVITARKKGGFTQHTVLSKLGAIVVDNCGGHMPTDVGAILDSDDTELKQRIDRQAYALFSGNPAKGGASEIVRLIGRRADQSAKRKLEVACERAKATKRR